MKAFNEARRRDALDIGVIGPLGGGPIAEPPEEGFIVEPLRGVPIVGPLGEGSIVGPPGGVLSANLPSEFTAQLVPCKQVGRLLIYQFTPIHCLK